MTAPLGVTRSMKILSIVCLGAGLLLIALGVKSILDERSRDKPPPTREYFDQINADRFNTDPNRREMEVFDDEPIVEPAKEIDFLSLGYLGGGLALVAIGAGLRILVRKPIDKSPRQDSSNRESEGNPAAD